MKYAWLITTDPETRTPETVWYFYGDAQEADKVLFEETRRAGADLTLWQLCTHSNVVDMEILLSKYKEDRPIKK